MFANQLIHIHKQNTRGRKCETRVIGVPDIFDFKKILKFWKNVHHLSSRTSRPTVVSPRRATSEARTRIKRRRRRRKRRKMKRIKAR